LEETMRARLLLSFLAAALLSAAALSGQDWRGKGRVDGRVKDAEGQPIADAKVELTRDSGGGTSAKTDKKGYWAVMGLIGGKWNVDISAPGFETRKTVVGVQEAGRTAPLEIQLQKAAAPAAAAVQPGKDVRAEVTAAVEQGNRLIGEKKYAEARAEYEKALAILPDTAPLWKGVAQTYHAEGNSAGEEGALRKVVQLEPGDTDAQILLADNLVNQGKAAEGKAILDGLAPGAVKDPAVYTNLAIVFMNKARPEEARAYMTKAIDLDPKLADSYYYRGLASVQAKKNAEAKADFAKYLELAPNGTQAKEVKEMLQALK
jgi:tetratricopeptide (TPR) repeat protein